jgi:anti-sigma factor RsiW
MTCQELVELVTAYLDGALDPASRQRFDAHLAECPGCREYLDQYRRTIAGLGRLTPDQLSADARDALLAAFRDWHRAG